MFEGLLQPTHLIIILAIALILFGPGKLPEAGSALGKSIKEFRQAMKEISNPDTASEAPAAAPKASSNGKSKSI
jgi:sec-independent protein translocase protein TatA